MLFPLPPFQVDFEKDPLLYIQLYILPVAITVLTLFMARAKTTAKSIPGPFISGKLSTFLYESASLIVFTTVLVNGISANLATKPLAIKHVFFGALYFGQFFYRSIILPFMVSHSIKPQSVGGCFVWCLFHALNGYNNARGILEINNITGSISWIGLALFMVFC